MGDDRNASADAGSAPPKPDPWTFPRRTFIGRSFGVALTIGAGGGLLAACGGGEGGSQGQVTVLGFESYIDPKLVALWKKSFPDIEFRGVPAADDNELFTKLKAGGADAYDVVFCDFGYCPLFRKAGLVEELDLSSFPAADDLYPQFREDVKAFPTYLLAPDKAVGFPCQWGPTAMTFNTTVDFVPTAPYRWSEMWDPSIPDNQVGFEGLPPDGFIATAALAKGYPVSKVYSLSGHELDDVVAYFRKLKPFRTFDADPITRNAIRTSDVWIALCPTPAFASIINRDAGKDVSKSVIPEEGSIGYVDGPMLVKGAPNRKNALTYINWFAGNKDVRDYIFTNYSNSPCSKAAVDRFLAQGGRTAELVKILNADDPDVAAHTVLGRPPDDAKAYAAAWDRIQA
jgi:spermidine/putrescine transport system substrate-binding protein